MAALASKLLCVSGTRRLCFQSLSGAIAHRVNAPGRIKQQRSVALAAEVTRGAWEERNLGDWATKRLKELLLSVEPINFTEGSASLTEVSKCTGEAAMLTIRGKRCLDFGFDITVDFQGKIAIGELSEEVEGTLQLDACYGDLDDLRTDIKFTHWPENIPDSERSWMMDKVTTFVPKIQDKLISFEKEFKDFSVSL